jgi:DNA-directed RNA polymerase specialized sigma24 family protein
MSLESIDTEAALRTLAILKAADRAERDPEPRVATEALLQKAGFSNAQIGEIVGEKSDTVRKRLERAGKAESKSSAKAKKK